LAMDTSAAIENVRLLREAEDKRRIDAEVRTAREVQAALIPETFRSTPAFEIAGTCVPCNELGGDYVDQFELGDGRSLLVVADVCGKGIAASLLAATLQGALAAQVGTVQGLDQLAARLNRVHARLAPTGKFVTMALVALGDHGAVELVDAGHCPLLHVHSGGVMPVATDGIALGIVDDAEYRVREVTAAVDDLLVLYTDGVIECEGPARELFGEQRLQAVLAGMRGRPAREVLDAINQAVTAFRRDAPVSDDCSVIVLRRV
jgi:sigma-B regulation protein RsbU (phosphoserine phosphatase)